MSAGFAELGRPDRLGAGLHDPSRGRSRHHLAVHRDPNSLQGCRTARPEGRCCLVLPVRPVRCRRGRASPADRQRRRVRWLGIALAATDVVVMPVLGRAKQNVGGGLGSYATTSEGGQNIVCAYLSLAVRMGLGATHYSRGWGRPRSLRSASPSSSSKPARRLAAGGSVEALDQ